MRARLLALLGLSAVILAPGCGDRGGARGTVRTLVLVTVDTLRRDRVGAYGRNEAATAPLTPAMDALAARGLRFDDARTPVPLTLPAHVTMLSGLPPASTGVRVNAYGRLPSPATRGFELLPERLRAAGWRTAAFVSAAPLSSRHGLDHGFETYDDEGLEDLTGLGYPERAGAETVSRALAHVRTVAGDQRLFLWIHLFEPHAPYAPGSDTIGPPERLYEIDVAVADRAIGALVQGLADAGRGDGALLLTSDHGEALEELGEKTHGILLGDAVLRVPFLLVAPGVPSAVRRDPVDLADVGPTLGALAGLDALPEEGPGTGRDLLAGPAPAERIRVSESLYARQRYGWAQLVAATDAAGTLVDAGGDRLYWLEAAPFLVPQRAPVDAAGRRGLERLGRAIREYRQAERPERITGGQTAGGYGGGNAAEPFLPPEENGRLTDPFVAIPRAYALDALADGLLRRGLDPVRIARKLESVAENDPRNPEVWFFLGLALTEQARRAPDPAEALRGAEAAFGKAFQLGRRDADTLVHHLGVNGKDRENEMLARLDALAGSLRDDCRVKVLEARLLRGAGRDEEADRVCREAQAACRTPREQALFEKARREETCR
jgi:hypothetical protein